MQEQVDDQDLAGLARPRVPAARPVASADPTVLGPAPAPLDCPYLHLDDDGPACLALPPAIRLSRRQVEIVCAVAAHVACPRLIKADAGRLPVSVDPPARVIRRDRPATDAAVVPASAAGLAASLEPSAPETEATPATAEPAAIPAATAAATAGATAIADAADVPAPASVHDPLHADPIVRPTRPAVAPPATPTTEPDAPAVTERIATALTLARVTARSHITLRPATAAAWVILVATLIIVIALLSARGGLTLPSLAPSSSALAGASAPIATPSAVAPSPSSSPSASVPPSTSASPSVGPSPSPSASASGASPFSPEQLAVLKPCPGKPDCYQYRIKSGDNLRNIATFFGVTYPALLAANPQITNPSIVHVGQQVVVPYPKAAKPSPTPKP